MDDLFQLGDPGEAGYAGLSSRLWGGKIDGNDYKPPNAYSDAVTFILKSLSAAAAGALAVLIIPETAFVGATIAGLSRLTLRGSALAVPNVVADGLYPSSNPITDAKQAVLWRKYLLENQRHKLK